MAIKKFLSESGFKHFVEKVIGKTDISSVGDGTLKGAVSSLNIKLDGKIGCKQIVVKPKTTTKITIPYNSAGFLIFMGASTTLFSLYQYCSYSSGLVGRTIGTQGTALTYTTSNTNVMTITNNDGNTLLVECMVFYGSSPS